MHMYELWKLPPAGHEPLRLEDGGGPILFPRTCGAEEYVREEADHWQAAYAIVPVQVGLA